MRDASKKNRKEKLKKNILVNIYILINRSLDGDPSFFFSS